MRTTSTIKQDRCGPRSVAFVKKPRAWTAEVTWRPSYWDALKEKIILEGAQEARKRRLPSLLLLSAREL
jgi:hypothetical protein